MLPPTHPPHTHQLSLFLALLLHTNMSSFKWIASCENVFLPLVLFGEHKKYFLEVAENETYARSIFVLESEKS